MQQLRKTGIIGLLLSNNLPCNFASFLYFFVALYQKACVVVHVHEVWPYLYILYLHWFAGFVCQ